MTVAELRALLDTLPDDLLVVGATKHGDYAPLVGVAGDCAFTPFHAAQARGRRDERGWLWVGEQRRGAAAMGLPMAEAAVVTT